MTKATFPDSVASAPASPLHILHLATTFPTSDDDTQPAFVRTLCVQLSNKARIVVVAPHAHNLPSVENVDGIEIHRFRYAPERLEILAYGSGILENLRKNKLTFLLLPGFVLGMTYCLLKLIARSRFDILHAHWWFPCGLIAGLVARCRPKSRRPRVVVTCHGGDVFALHGLIFDFLLKLTSCTVDRLIAVSASVKRNLVDRAIAADHISIAPMGVDIENLFVPPEDNRSREGIVFVGRLVEKKGVDTLLRATAILRDRGVVQQVTIAGDGPLRAHLEDLASELGIREQVRFLGSVPNTKTVAIYQSASLAVFPFRRARSGDQDGLGLVMPEAMGCECCVIASNLENTRDVILDGETGMTFEADDPVALADVLRTVVHDFPHIPDLLRKAGRQHASQLLDWRNVVNNHMRIYSDLCIENGESHG